jgi:hypothetical protein
LGKIIKYYTTPKFQKGYIRKSVILIGQNRRKHFGKHSLKNIIKIKEENIFGTVGRFYKK